MSKILEINSKKHGKFNINLDEDDFNRLNIYKWTINVKGKYVYAYRTFTKNKKKIFIKLHREILNVTDSKILVDHINHNTLDNRKNNLRLVNHSLNGMNRTSKINSNSKYLGVGLDKRTGKWIAKIKRIYLGKFINEIDAAKAYDKKALILYKEFANLNFKNNV